MTPPPPRPEQPWDRRERHYYRGHWHRWRRHPGGRPPWWPADEPFPPTGDFPWRRIKRRFFVRVAVLVSIVTILVLIGPVVLISILLDALGLPAPASGVIALGLVLLLLVGLSGVARRARRIAAPIGDLIEAAGRVEAGDYAVRVAEPIHGPSELGSLTHAFNDMAAHLETDERQRRTLLADVSHEMRTPLAVLQGELEAMIDGIHTADEAHLSAALDEIKVMTSLVEDLRTLALAEAGTLPLHREPTDLAVLVAEVATSFEALAAGSGVTIRVNVADGLPLVDLDPLRIHQVLSNLVANALRYAPRGSEVAIEAVPGGAGHVPGHVPGRGPAHVPAVVTISVVDQGPGIPPDLLPHVFERFAKSAESRGSGLGLAIARRLVEAHGGTIRAERPGEIGTAIRFQLPERSTDAG